jgi:hypothetical protein
MDDTTNQQTTTGGVDASSSSGSADGVVKPSGDAGVPTATETAAPPWSPDFTYEFDGKKREIDPLFRSVIKDEESLKKVRDYVQRADALTKYKGKVEGYEKDWKPVVDTVTKLQQFYAKGDHEKVFQTLGYDDQAIFQYVRNKLQQAQLPENERMAIEAKKQAELEKEQYSEQYSNQQSQLQQELSRVTQIEMDIELGKPEFVKMKEAYDKAYGDGSFKDLVIERGAYLVDQRGSHVRPGEVLQSVARDFMPFMSASQPTEDVQQQTQKPRVIPNVGKGSGSPARTAIRSMADLKKRAAQLGD